MIQKPSQIEADNQKQANSFPCYALIELTNRCNLECVMCKRRASSFKKGDMSLELFAKIKRGLFPHLKQLGLSGLGESLLCKDFLSMLKEANDYGIYTFLYDNGTLLTDEIINGLIDYGLNEYLVSIDGVKRETFERIRIGARFDEVITNVKRLNEIKAQRGLDHPEIKVQFVAMRDNIEELPAMIPLIDSIGARELIVNLMFASFEEIKAQSLFYHKQLYNDTIIEAENMAIKYGIRLAHPPLFYNRDAKTSNQKCNVPWSRIFIQYDGKARPCSSSYDVIGNIASDPFEEIWNGPRMQDFRRRFLSDNPPLGCLTCHSLSIQKMDEEMVHFFPDYGKYMIL